jgi:glycosyltransferase involved in cell wall biosynthesis
MKILHATESFASGVMDLIAALALRQVEQGADVTVLFVERPDTPNPERLAKIFDSRIVLVKASGLGAGKAVSLLALRRAIHRQLRLHEVEVIHLHSSWAGLVGRVGFGARRYSKRTFFSPHGFSFLRQDLPAALRRILISLERVGARRGFVILTNDSELAIARKALPRAELRLLVNGIRVSELPTVEVNDKHRLQVVMVGRITYQKAPWVFAGLADEFSDIAEFIWYGDGPRQNIQKWLGTPNVRISGWIPIADLRQKLTTADLLLFPTLWEGMPLSLIEAQSIGVPAVATRIVGNQDIVVDGQTGYLCDSPEEVRARTRELLLDKALRRRMSKNAIELVRPKFDDRSYGKLSIDLYTQALESI